MVNPVNVNHWISVPNEIYKAVFLNLSHPCKVREVCKQWLSIIDHDAGFWETKFETRFRKLTPLFHTLRAAPQFKELFVKEPLNYTKIYENLEKNVESVLGHPSSNPVLLIYEPVMDMEIKFYDEKPPDIFYLTVDRKLNRVSLDLNGEKLACALPQTLAQFSESDLPTCLCLHPQGVLVGTSSKKVFNCRFINNGNLYVSSILAQPLENKPIRIETLQADNHLYLHTISEDTLCDFFSIPTDTGFQATKIHLTGNVGPLQTTLGAIPKLCGPHFALCSFSYGGLFLFNLEKGAAKELILRDDSNTPKSELVINALCVISNRVVFSTKNGKLGWFDKQMLEHNQIYIQWIKRPSSIKKISSISPCGQTGIFLHYELGLMEPLIFPVNGPPKFGLTFKKNMQNPIWVENKKMIYLEPCHEGNKVFLQDYSTLSNFGAWNEFKDQVNAYLG